MKTEELEPIWRALSDPTRRRILDLLLERPHTTGQLGAAFPLSRFAVMKHIDVLVRADLVVVRRRGRERWNHLNALPLRAIQQGWLGRYQASRADGTAGHEQAVETARKGNVPMPNRNPTANRPGTMQIEQDVLVKAPPQAVFDAIVGDVSAWWGRPYVHAEAPWAIVLEPHVGGRFFEDLGGGEGALYATVTGLVSPREVRLAGPFGIDGMVHNVVALSLEPAAGGTILHLAHLAAGDISEERRSACADRWRDLLGVRLPAFVERGVRMGLGHEPLPSPPGDRRVALP